MRSKPGNLKHCLFLVSIFLSSCLLAQLPVTKKLVTVKYTFSSPPSFAWGISSSHAFASYSYPKINGDFFYSDTTRKKDRDGDGILDSLDKCPDEKGIIQYDGCPVPDSDNDGVTDNNDACPTTRGLAKYKGCPAPDSDGDKINDDDDKCASQPGVARYDGCPVGDRDKDGVNDDDDKCLDIIGTVNNQGCPENNKSGNKAETFKGKKSKKANL